MKKNANPLKPDTVTNGLLTSLLYQTWQASKREVPKFVTIEELRHLHYALENFENEDIFGEVAQTVSLPIESLESYWNTSNESLEKKSEITPKDWSDFEKEILRMKTEHIKLFDKPGFILYDGYYGAGGGHFGYIYKAKGSRIVWFKDGTIADYAVYATLGEDGFNFVCEDVFYPVNLMNPEPQNSEDSDDANTTNIGFSLEGFPEDQEWVSRYAQTDFYVSADGRWDSPPYSSGLNYGRIGDAYFWIKMLANINKQYDRTFFLEYFITPADVLELSIFSRQVRHDLWQAIFELAKDSLKEPEEDSVNDLLKFSINFMKLIEIEPPVSELITFFEHLLRNQTSQNLEKIFTLLTDIKQHNLDLSTKMGIVQEQVSSIKEDTGEIADLIGDLQNSVVMLRKELASNSISDEEFVDRIADKVRSTIGKIDLTNIEKRLSGEFSYLTRFLQDKKVDPYKTFLLTAEYLYQERLSKGVKIDSAVAIVEYSKIVDAILKAELGQPIISDFKRNNKNWKGFTVSNLSRPIYPNSLGAWNYLTSANLSCQDYLQWITANYSKDKALIRFLTSELGVMTEKFRSLRNGAAHDSTYGLTEARKMRGYLLVDKDSNNQLCLMEWCLKILYYSG